MAWLEGWSYRKPITVTAGSNGMPSDYQVLVTNPIYNESNLEGSWHFNEGSGTVAKDSSGKGRDGTISGATWTTGKFGNGLQFDGVDDYVQYPKAVCDAILSAQKLTISLWFKWSTLATGKTLVMGADGAGYYLHTNASDASKIDFEIYYSGTWYRLTSATSVSTGTWYHIVATWDGSTMRLYFNGVQDANTLSRSAMSDRASSGDRTFSNLSSANAIGGIMDEVRIYSRALSPEEIREHYLAKARPDYEDIRFTKSDGTTTLSYWKEADGKFWVKDPDSLSANTSHTLYVCYGNPSATSTSDFGNVFPVFNDNAESGVLTDKWTKYVEGGTDSSGYSSEQARSGAKSIKVWNTGGAGCWTYVYKTLIATTSRRFVAWFYDTGDTSLTANIGIFKDTTPTTDDFIARMGIVTSVSSSYYCYELEGGSWVTSSKARSVGWHKFQIDLVGGTVKVYIDDTLLGSQSTSSSAQDFELLTGGTGSSDGFYADDVFFAALVSPEPTTSVGNEQVNLTGWLYRRKITIDHTKIDSDLTSFPITVFLSSSNFDFSKARSDGYDIRFVANDGMTLLSYERERHDSSNQVAEYHVRIPTVSSSSDTELYIYYGNSNAQDISNPPAVWDSNYKAVWHMDDWTSSTIKDARAIYHGTKTGVNEPQQIDGKIGKGQSFDGSNDKITISGNPIGVNYTDPFTVELWMKTNSATTYQWLFGKYQGINPSGYYGWFLAVSDTGKLVFVTNKSQIADTQIYSDNTISAATWYYVAAVLDSSRTMKMYVNGVQQTQTGTGQDGSPNPYNTNIGYNQSGNNIYFNGVIDEVRASYGARSAAWIKATYYTTSNSLLSIGNEEVLFTIVSDSGTGVESIVITTSISISESGTGSEVSLLSASLTVSETGSGTDSPNITGQISASDSGSGSEVIDSTGYVIVSEASAGSDAITRAEAIVPVEDSGMTSDSIKYIRNPPTKAGVPSVRVVRRR